MGKICVIHIEKHDLFIAHCYMDFNNVLNRVRNFPEEKLPGRSTCLCVPTAPGEMSNVSSYTLRMARLSAQIFGNVVRPTDSKSMKVVKLFSEQPLAKREEVYNWYPPHNTYYALMKKLRYFGLYRDEHQDFREEMRRLKKLRGKEKPKKGEGKRALKKK
uniref:Small ribosomal subunit protein mS33 n=2 Tax=Taeniopygia guttata TaxID=59729 RepID=A0A674H7I4_TAEGU